MTIRISAGEAIILKYVLNSKKPCTYQQIKTATGYSQDTVSNILDMCVFEGIVEKKRQGRAVNFSVPNNQRKRVEERIASANEMTKAGKMGGKGKKK